MTKQKVVSLETVIADIAAYSKAATTAENKGAALANDMVALGIVPGAFYAPKKDAPEVKWTLADGAKVTHAALYSQLKAAVVASMPASQQKLLALPKAAVPAHLKDPRNKAQCAISARMADLRKAVERRMPKPEAAAKPEAEKAEAAETAASGKSAKIRIGERLIAAMKIAQADEKPDYEHRKLTKALSDALTMLGMEMPAE